MLMLSRAKDQWTVLTIPGEYMADGKPLTIRVVLADFRRPEFRDIPHARMGWDAPRYVRISRAELLEDGGDAY